MSMDRVAWSSLYNITRASSGSKPFSKDAQAGVQLRPHKGKLIAFVLLSIVMAVLAVATPVLPARSWTRSSPARPPTSWSGWPC